MTNLFLQFILFVYNTLAFQNLGLAIIEIALLARILLHPITKQQLEYSHKMRKLQPHMDAIKKKHQGNQQAQAQAQMQLFKEHGINPAAGCLPTIVQFVVLIGLLGAMNEILKMNINTQFFIWDLAKPDAYQVGLPIAIPGILVFLAALTQFIQVKMMLPTPPRVRKEDKPKEVEEKVDFATSFAQSQASMAWMFPLLLLVFGTQWPSGLALYWTVSSLLSISQQYRMSGWGGMSDLLTRFAKK